LKSSCFRCLSIFAMLSLLALAGVWAQQPPAASSVRSVQQTESRAQRDARMAWWREARFGMFIHWGLYSIPAGSWKDKPVEGYGEWVMDFGSIPVADYKQLAGRFNPTAFDAHSVVALAKAAGMKYIVVTTKHHDGFALFRSAVDPFNIVQATPYRHDPLRDLVDECHKQGMRLGFYYSQAQDWTAPGGAAWNTPGHAAPSHHWDAAQDGDFDDYLDHKAIPQLRELLTNYGSAPDILWFDTPTSSMTPARSARIVALLNQHPTLIWNDRLGEGYKGDTDTPEQFIPPQGFPDRDWESCMTMNHTWGYKAGDHEFKSAEELLRNLIDVASKGGNYLLNIGPDATGAVPAEERERLLAMGQWLKVNGEAIYGTKATLFGSEAGHFSQTEKEKDGKPKFIPEWKWRSTTREGKIYLELFEWPGTTFHLGKLPRPVAKAYLLADPSRKPLALQKSGNGLDIVLPAKAPDPVASVVVLETLPPGSH